MPSNKRTNGRHRARPVSQKASGFCVTRRTGRLTSPAATSSIKRSHIPGPTTLLRRAFSCWPTLSRITIAKTVL
jgi:hypothetical protein